LAPTSLSNKYNKLGEKLVQRYETTRIFPTSISLQVMTVFMRENSQASISQ